MLETDEKNKARKPGEENAFVIGLEGVRKWIVERFDVCLECAQKFLGYSERILTFIMKSVKVSL